MKHIILFFFLFFSCLPSYCDIWYVDGTNGNDGTNIVNDPNLPSLTILDVVGEAGSGDIIYIASGTYTSEITDKAKSLTFIGIGKVVWDSGTSSVYFWSGAEFTDGIILNFKNITFRKGLYFSAFTNGISRTCSFFFDNCKFVPHSVSATVPGACIATTVSETNVSFPDTMNSTFDNCTFRGDTFTGSFPALFGSGNNSANQNSRYGIVNSTFNNCLFDKNGAVNIFNEEGAGNADAVAETWNLTLNNCSYSDSSADINTSAGFGTINTTDTLPKNSQSYTFRDPINYDFHLNPGTSIETLTESSQNSEIGLIPGVSIVTFDQPSTVTDYPGNKIYTDSSATGAADGTSWLDAYTTIQLAVDNSSDGDIIFIRNAGTIYTEQIVLAGIFAKSLKFVGIGMPSLTVANPVTTVNISLGITASSKYHFENLVFFKENNLANSAEPSISVAGISASHDVKVKNCILFGPSDGVKSNISSSNTNDSIDLENCTFISNTNGSVTGNNLIQADAAETPNFKFVNCYLDDYDEFRVGSGGTPTTTGSSNGFANRADPTDEASGFTGYKGSVEPLAPTYFKNWHNYEIASVSTDLKGQGANGRDIGAMASKHSWLPETNAYFTGLYKNATGTASINQDEISIPVGMWVETEPFKFDNFSTFTPGNFRKIFPFATGGTPEIFARSGITESDMFLKTYSPLGQTRFGGGYGQLIFGNQANQKEFPGLLDEDTIALFVFDHTGGGGTIIGRTLNSVLDLTATANGGPSGAINTDPSIWARDHGGLYYISFDKTDDYYEIASNLIDGGLTVPNWTIDIFARWPTLPPASPGNYEQIYDDSGNQSTNGWGIRLNAGAPAADPHSVVLWYYDSAGPYFNPSLATAAIPANTWIQIIARRGPTTAFDIIWSDKLIKNLADYDANPNNVAAGGTFATWGSSVVLPRIGQTTSGLNPLAGQIAIVRFSKVRRYEN